MGIQGFELWDRYLQLDVYRRVQERRIQVSDVQQIAFTYCLFYKLDMELYLENTTEKILKIFLKNT